ncbi:hypothetical protein OE09_0603 [Flavobacteriaceae bacterium MAR_2010_72]|nr:hypothetical protein OE09_0603 [Flavobacteriaceae bacterium MAR_2010_72]
MKIFRTIRHRLLNEGKTVKYLKYAFGETFLVVVGILLAVQANNWNEDRIEDNLEQTYLNRLHPDLHKDRTTLLFARELSETRIEQIDLLTTVMKYPDSSFSNYDQIIESIEKVTWRSYLPLSRIVYNELLDTGRMTLIESEGLREELAMYYAEADHWEVTLKSLEYQREFSKATAGLLNKDILTLIENSESLNSNAPKQVDFSLDNRQVKDIIYQLALNKDAAKWLPQINHYHVLSKKVIDLLLTKNESLLKSIESQIH